MRRRTTIVALFGTAGVVVAAMIVAISSAPPSPRAAVICASCGHRFEVAVDQYRSAAGKGGGSVRCPRCGKAGSEPVLAVCPHCDKPILHSQLDPSQPGYAQRLCPHCGKKVQTGPAPHTRPAP